MADRADDWFRQAEDDLRWAQACFAAQKVAEKALKSVALRRGVDQAREAVDFAHRIVETARRVLGRLK